MGDHDGLRSQSNSEFYRHYVKGKEWWVMNWRKKQGTDNKGLTGFKKKTLWRFQVKVGTNAWQGCCRGHFYMALGHGDFECLLKFWDSVIITWYHVTSASNKCPDKSPRTHGLLDLHFLFWTEDIFFKKWRRTERELLCENLLFSTEAISRLCSMSTNYSDSGMKWWGQEWTQTSQLLIQCSLLTEFIDSKC